MSGPFPIPSTELFLARRTFLKLAGGAAFLAACGDGNGGGGGTDNASPTTDAAPAPRLVLDPDTPWWLQGNYAPVTKEVEAFDLAVTGALPPALAGLYVRNGSNPATGSSPHWFLGDGMVHGIHLEGGKARAYRNRWVKTPLYEQRAEFADLSVGAPGDGVSQSNVSVIHHHGKLLTLGEVGWPYELSADDLATVGPHELVGPGTLGPNVTAHPKRDPDTGKLHFFGYGFVAPYLTYYVAAADGTLELAQQVDVAGPTMIHDFAITDRDAIFWEFPVVFDFDAAVNGGDFPFRWEPSYGSRIGIMPLEGPTSAIRWVEVDDQFVFHGTNAFRDGDEIVVDVNRQQSAFAPGGDPPGSLLHRWRIDTSGPELRWREEQLSETWMDLPRIDERHTGRKHGRGYYASFTDTVDEGLQFRGVVGFDPKTGEEDAWVPHEALHAGEVVFVPDGDDAGPDEGWLLTYVYDRRTEQSAFTVLDATDLASGPVASVTLPQRVP
ncbi:MAG TPA: carotenoid oxygenase family protein, partial [Acidimicrobiia bacterium]|nr:carotenoid oxygenase family protein [Acidimicrobiia bacterium]